MYNMSKIKGMKEKNIYTLACCLLLVASPLCFFFTTTISANEDIQWDCTIQFTTTGGESDTLIFGEATSASQGQDSLDVPKPPTPQQPYVRAWFSTPLDAPYTSLWEDYRPSDSHTQTWNISTRWVSENTTETQIQLVWDTTQITSSGYVSTYLSDMSNITIEMKNQGIYSFSASANTLYQFQLVFEGEQSGQTEPSSEIPYVWIVGFICLCLLVVGVIFWKRRIK